MTQARPTPRRSRSVRGALTCAAMFVLGGAVLWGLFRAQRATSPRSPEVPWGVPARVLRVVSADCGWDEAGEARGMTPEEVLPELAGLAGDIVLLRGVRSQDAIAYAEGVGMQRSFHRPLYQALGTRPRGPVGCLVLSRHPLYDAAPLRRGEPDAACVGVRATVVVDGVRFWVATGRAGRDDAIGRERRGAGSPPLISAGDSAHAGFDTGGRWDLENQGIVQIRGTTIGSWADMVPTQAPKHDR